MSIEIEIKNNNSEREVRMHPTERDKRAVLFLVEQGFATIEQLWKVGWGDQRTASYATESSVVCCGARGEGCDD